MIHTTDNLKQKDQPDQNAIAATARDMLDVSSPHQRGLLNIFAITDQHQLDPTPLILSYADELPRTYREQIHWLVNDLEEGVELGEAFNNVPTLLSPLCVLGIQLATKEGRLSELYQALLDQEPSLDRERHYEPGYFMKYVRLLVTCLLFNSIFSFILVAIVPELLLIFEDFEIPTPSILTFLCRMNEYFIFFWLLLFLCGLIMIPFNLPAFRHFLQRFNPFLWAQTWYSPATIQKLGLAMLTRFKYAIPVGITMLSKADAPGKYLKRLDCAKTKLSQGETAGAALTTAKIISPTENKALQLPASAETQAWLLRWSALNQQQRNTNWQGVVSTLIHGSVYTLLGGLVFIVCLAIFTMLINIINSLHGAI